MIGVADLLGSRSHTGSAAGRRRLRARELAVLLGVLCSLAGCNNDTSDPTADTLKCARRLYADYSPKNMKQCVDVCISCERGSMTTCSTSCTMKGAK